MSKLKTWKKNSKKSNKKNANFPNAENLSLKNRIIPITNPTTASHSTMLSSQKDQFLAGPKGFMIT